MTNEKKISILMPCFNSEAYIDQAINSILNQTYTNWELLICNDYSTDNSLEKIKKYSSPKIKVFENEKNLGYLKTCNKLFQLATGDYVTFQDSDDYSEHNRLETLILAFSNDPDLSVCGSQFQFMTNEGVKLPNESPNYPLTHSEIANQFPELTPFCGASVMLKKEVLNAFPKYDEYWDRIGAEDHYWLFKISEKFKVANIQDILYYYRHNPKSVSRNKTNARKMHCHDFFTFFINQRKSTGTDFIEQNNVQGILEMENSFLKPYQENPNLIHFRQADWAFDAKNNKLVLHHIFNAIKNNPYNSLVWRTLWYYFKKIYLKK